LLKSRVSRISGRSGSPSDTAQAGGHPRIVRDYLVYSAFSRKPGW